MAEAKTTEPLVMTWLTLSEHYYKENNLMWHQEFPTEYPSNPRVGKTFDSNTYSPSKSRRLASKYFGT